MNGGRLVAERVLHATTRTQMEKHWDGKLTQRTTNPYPLAPVDLVRTGLVDKHSYESQNKGFGDFCNSHMKQELQEWNKTREIGSSSRGKHIHVFGGGLGRDLEWLEYAIRLGFFVTVRDISAVALNKVDTMLMKKHADRVSLKHVDFEEDWDDNDASVKGVSLIYSGQGIQVQSRDKMKRVMRLISNLLRFPSEPLQFYPPRAAYLVHPFGEDNSSNAEWNGYVLPRVEWGDTTPYSKTELLAAIGAKDKLQPIHMRVLGTHHYFHQTYSFVKFSVTKGDK